MGADRSSADDFFLHALCGHQRNTHSGKMAPMPALRTTLRTHPLATLGLIALFTIAAALWLRDAGDRADEMLHGDRYLRPPFNLSPLTLEVTWLDSSVKASGPGNGDVVLTVNRIPLDGLTGYFGQVRRARFGDRLRVRIRCVTSAGPIEQNVSLPVQQFTYVGYTGGSSPAYWFRAL
jgi:hypothetical protein